jgi:hypothetical protein
MNQYAQSDISTDHSNTAIHHAPLFLHTRAFVSVILSIRLNICAETFINRCSWRGGEGSEGAQQDNHATIKIPKWTAAEFVLRLLNDYQK